MPKETSYLFLKNSSNFQIYQKIFKKNRQISENNEKFFGKKL